MKISRLQRDDAGSLVVLARAVQQLHVEHQPDRYRAIHDDAELERWIVSHLEQEGAIGFCAKVDREVIGYLIAIISKTEAHPLLSNRRIVILDEISVHPDHQRKGVADALLDTLKREGKRQGASAIRSSYASFNASSSALLRKHGMVPMTITCEGPL
ncbi:GNAT family N-acetyltransferase [Pseudooceanicola spongiae]|uniref:GNAT family N-acetyltransferase n=1 Tax=Pseudooceanicola spongiae TaxID=2613965 RepID=A0A7L9WLN7_9RHOB|nr:GNAT family N-acetyltransferase [Pseudooceanicola spongiae]QOL80843.1 GNAT family N-acetyltransferase [Pseudooceanicola spongiae]